MACRRRKRSSSSRSYSGLFRGLAGHDPEAAATRALTPLRGPAAEGAPATGARPTRSSGGRMRPPRGSARGRPPKLALHLLGSVGGAKRAEEVAPEHFGLVRGIALDESMSGLRALGSEQVHHEDAGSGCAEARKRAPEHRRIAEVVEQAVREDEVEGPPGQRSGCGGQLRFVETDAPGESCARGCLARQREHRGRAVQAMHLPARKGAREAEGRVARTAAEVEGEPRLREVGEALREQRHEALVRLCEVGGRVGPRLRGVEHQLGLGDAIHLASSVRLHGGAQASPRPACGFSSCQCPTSIQRSNLRPMRRSWPTFTKPRRSCSFTEGSFGSAIAPTRWR